MKSEGFVIKNKQDFLDLMKDAGGIVTQELLEESISKSMELIGKKNAGLIGNVIAAQAEQSEKKAAMTPGLKAAHMIRKFAEFKGDIVAMEKYATDKEVSYPSKALGVSAGSTGGFLVEGEQGELILSLAADSVVRKLGARIIKMSKGSITFPAGDTAASANWVGENTNAGSSTPGLRMVTLEGKKLMVIIPISNEFLHDGGDAGNLWVRDEARKITGTTEDLAFLRGTGTVNQPLGLLGQVASGNSFDITHAAAAATVAEVFADIGRCIQKIADQNVPMLRMGWAFSKRTEYFLKHLLNGLSMPMFPEMMSAGLFMGWPFASTTQIPNNLDTSGTAANNETDIYLCDFMSILIGDTMETELSIHEGAAYYDTGSSAVVSALSLDQTVVAMRRRVDITSSYEGKDIAIIRSADWGA